MSGVNRSCLVKPSLRFMRSYVEALREGLRSGDCELMACDEIDVIDADPAAFISKLLAPPPELITTPTGEQVAPVPFDQFWLLTAQIAVGL